MTPADAYAHALSGADISEADFERIVDGAHAETCAPMGEPDDTALLALAQRLGFAQWVAVLDQRIAQRAAHHAAALRQRDWWERQRAIDRAFAAAGYWDEVFFDEATGRVWSGRPGSAPSAQSLGLKRDRA